MVAPPVCPACGSLGVGERCGSCGAQMTTSVATPDDGTGVSIGGLPADLVGGVAKAPGLEARERQAAAYLALQQSEQAVLHAASRIFAALIASGHVTEQNQNEQSDRAVQLATRMAVVIEKYVQSDDEDW